MAYVDEIKRGSYDGGVYFVGSFESGATVYWGTRVVPVLAGGFAEPRLLSFPTTSYGMGETWDSDLEIGSVTLELDNSDGALAEYALGCDPSTPAVGEYTGDSFLNLSGKLVHFTVRDGTLYTQDVSGQLYCERGISFDDTTIRLTMSPRGASDIGKCVYGTLTVRHLLDSTEGVHASGAVNKQVGMYASGSGIVVPGSTTDTITQGEFTALLESVEGVEDGVADKEIPFIFGRNVFTPVALGEVTFKASTSVLHVLGLTVQAPAVGSVSRWYATPGDSDGWLAYSKSNARKYDRPYAFGRVGYIKRDILCDDGTTRAAWVVFVLGAVVDWGDDYKTQRTAIGAIVPAPNSVLGLDSADAQTPAALVERIVTDLSESSVSVMMADFTRAKAAQHRAHSGAWGGAVYGSADLGEIVSVIAGSGHLGVWLDRTGSLRCLAPPGWDSDDVAALSGLPSIMAADLLGTPAVMEVLPSGENERGAATSEVTVEWTEQQLGAVPPNVRINRARGGYVPSSRGFPVEATIRGDWIFPLAARPLYDAVRHRNRFTRRIHATTRLWVGAGYDVGQMFRFYSTLGRGGAGHDARLVRLEHVELDFAQDAATCRFEDLGPIEGLVAVVLDDEDNWIRHDPQGTGVSISLSDLDGVVIADSGTPFATAQVGDHLWTFGAADSRNRVSRRIVGVTDSQKIEVESAYPAAEAALATVAGPGADVIDLPWVVMKSQETMSPTNTTKLTLCDENTNQFRDGSNGFVVSG